MLERWVGFMCVVLGACAGGPESSSGSRAADPVEERPSELGPETSPVETSPIEGATEQRARGGDTSARTARWVTEVIEDLDERAENPRRGLALFFGETGAPVVVHSMTAPASGTRIIRRAEGGRWDARVLDSQTGDALRAVIGESEARLFGVVGDASDTGAIGDVTLDVTGSSYRARRTYDVEGYWGQDSLRAAVDGSGRVALCFTVGVRHEHGIRTEMRLAIEREGALRTEPLPDSLFCDVAFDREGSLLVAFRAEREVRIRRVTAGRAAPDVTVATRVDSPVVLGIDASDRPWLVYMTASDGRSLLEFGRRDPGGAWSFLRSTEPILGQSSFDAVVDGSGAVHIVYLTRASLGPRDVVYAVAREGALHSEPLDLTSRVPPRIALDARGRPWIAAKPEDGRVVLAHRVEPGATD